MQSRFDVIIVGAGAAGCVLAGRLSANPAIQVLLVEAGADAPPGREDPSILDSYPVSFADPRFSWPNLIAETGAQPAHGGPRLSRPYLQGRGVGGTSNINGMIAVRGYPEDYDEWRDHGATGWGWDDVLPFFRRLETDRDFDGPLHGHAGPIPIRRFPADRLSPLARAFAEVVMDRGYPLVEDLNGDFRDGVGPLPNNNLPTGRVSASIGYLDASVRLRSNLTILADTAVERVNFQGARTVGVTARRADGLHTFEAREVVLSAGGLYSPAILMRSGVGPAQHLKALGIEVVSDLPGVGQNLMNHPEVTIATHLPRRAMQAAAQRALGQNILRYSSGLEGCQAGDMTLSPLSMTGWHPLGRRVGALSIAVYKPYSLGDVQLTSADPAVSPQVRFNLLSDPRDLERLTAGLKLLFEVMADRRVAQVRNEAFLPDGKIAKSLGERNTRNWLQAMGITLALDGPGAVRRILLGASRLDPAALAADPAALKSLVLQRAQPVHHVCGTCRMGRVDDPGVVVDANCSVAGVQGLRVIDASIMPTLVRANTHLPAMMIGEKMAQSLGKVLA